MKEFFGYDRVTKVNDQIISSDFFVFSIGKRVSLMQSINLTYQRNIQPTQELGSTTIIFTHGGASGNLNVSRFVGKEGILKAFQGGECGKISAMSINIEGDGSCAVSGSGSLSFDGGIVQSVGVNATAGQLNITESATILFGSLIPS